MTMAGIAALLCATLALAMPAAAYDAGDLARLKAGEDCEGCNLAGADLSGFDLTQSTLTRAQLRGANLSQADLSDAILDYADLHGAKLRDADLTGASLVLANLDGADLTGANVLAADFTAASLEGTEVTGTNMRQAVGADLSAAFDRTPPSPSPATVTTDQRIGTVFLVAFPYCPTGTLEADGSALPVQDNEVLYSLYGLTYGGDYPKTFHLPDLRAQVPLPQMRYCVVSAGVYPSRS